MTADWVKLPHDLLEKLSSRIINEVKGVNRAEELTFPANRPQRLNGVTAGCDSHSRARAVRAFTCWGQS